MNIITFKYTKSATDTSERVYVPLTIPNLKNYFGIDITELSVNDQAIFATKVEKILEAGYNEIVQLMRNFDIAHNFRSFTPDKMSDIQEENI